MFEILLFGLDLTSSDEGIPLSGEEEISSKSLSDHRRLPTHVYKEYLPSTIYRTGEARSIRVCSNLVGICVSILFVRLILEYNC